MSETLLKALKFASESANTEMINFSDQKRAKWAGISRATSDPVAEALFRIDSIAAVDGKYVATPGSTSRFDIRSAATHLVYNATKYGPEDVCRSLLSIFDSRKIEAVDVKAVAGLQVTYDVQLDENIWLVPAANAPDVDWSRRVFSASNTEGHQFSFAPSSAILITRNINLEFYDGPDDENLHRSLPQPAESKRIPDVLRSIVLSTDAVPEIRDTYSVIRNVGWPGQLCSGGGGSFGFPRKIPFNRPVNASELRSAYILQCVADSVDIENAVSKLISARCRESNEEKAIDYGTLLEIMLTRGDGNSGEIGLRVATRAAWLLGDSYDKRKEYFDLAKQVYDLRSKSVHTGSINKSRKYAKYSTDDWDRLFGQIDNFCCEMALDILRRKQYPNWVSLVLDG